MNSPTPRRSIWSPHCLSDLFATCPSCSEKPRVGSACCIWLVRPSCIRYLRWWGVWGPPQTSLSPSQQSKPPRQITGTPNKMLWCIFMSYTSLKKHPNINSDRVRFIPAISNSWPSGAKNCCFSTVPLPESQVWGQTGQCVALLTQEKRKPGLVLRARVDDPFFTLTEYVLCPLHCI